MLWNFKQCSVYSGFSLNIPLPSSAMGNMLELYTDFKCYEKREDMFSLYSNIGLLEKTHYCWFLLTLLGLHWLIKFYMIKVLDSIPQGCQTHFHWGPHQPGASQYHNNYFSLHFYRCWDFCWLNYELCMLSLIYNDKLSLHCFRARALLLVFADTYVSGIYISTL